MAKKTANDLIQMFADRKSLDFVPTSGSAWAQRNGNEAGHFWISRKQTDWVLGVYIAEVQAERNLDEAEGVIFLDGIETVWKLNQMSTKRNNGAGVVNLARYNGAVK